MLFSCTFQSDGLCGPGVWLTMGVRRAKMRSAFLLWLRARCRFRRANPRFDGMSIIRTATPNGFIKGDVEKKSPPQLETQDSTGIVTTGK